MQNTTSDFNERMQRLFSRTNDCKYMPFYLRYLQPRYVQKMGRNLTQKYNFRKRNLVKKFNVSERVSHIVS